MKKRDSGLPSLKDLLHIDRPGPPKRKPEPPKPPARPAPPGPGETSWPDLSNVFGKKKKRR